MHLPILVIDNYDSFTYNLVHYLEKYATAPIHVYRNDKITLSQINSYQNIVLSPGPGLPRDAGILCSAIKEFASSKNILGICLGHQAIAEVFGGELYNLPEVYHGVAHKIKIIKQSPISEGIPNNFLAGRYHSWAVKKDNLPNCFVILMQDENDVIMAIKHKIYNVYGIQFHPESILTEYGEKIIENWIFRCIQSC
jgi:anthranilate synthase component 2